MSIRALALRTRAVGADGSERADAILRTDWDPARAAVVICDMWDAHHCVAAQRHTAEMAPRMDEVAAALREQGALIIHAPAGCADFYRGTPARMRAIQAPHADAPAAIDWNGWDQEADAALPSTLTEPGSCSCGTAQPCGEAHPPYPWTRQTPRIGIHPEDAVSDDGRRSSTSCRRGGSRTWS
jgi:hypothetical protein